jgi:hypothetical protein
MPTVTELVFAVIHLFLNAPVLGSSAVTLALIRELYPNWNRHPALAFVTDAALAALIFALVILVAVLLASAP